MEDNGLKLAIPKTEAVMLTNKRAYERPLFMINVSPYSSKNKSYTLE